MCRSASRARPPALAPAPRSCCACACAPKRRTTPSPSVSPPRPLLRSSRCRSGSRAGKRCGRVCLCHALTAQHVFSWYCGGQVYRATLSKTTLSNVSLELVAATDGAAEAARAVFQRLAQRPDRLYREVYENERKIHVLGQTKYSKGALTVLDRPAWSSSDGRRLGSPDVVMLPSPRWRWCGAWTLETAEQYTDADGWRYASGWWEGGEWRAGAAFGRLVRRRRWIRFQEKVPAEEPPARAAAVPRAAPPLNASALLAHLARTLPAWCDAAPFLEHEPRLPFLTLKQALFEVRAAAIALTVDHAAQDAAGVCRDLQGAPRRVAPPPAQGPFLCR